jgi:hypothetical protein
MYPKLLITFMLMLTAFMTVKGQCDYVWKRIRSEDTILIHSDLIVNLTVDADSLNSILALFRNRIRVPRDPDVIIYQQNIIDSLRKLPADSLISDEISSREEYIKSVFQDHMLGKVGYALYNIDTFSIDGRKIVVYQVSSNLETFWNEDFSNWMFLYTREFGVIRYRFTGSFEELPGFETGYLVSNCHLSDQEIQELRKLQEMAKFRYQ